MSNLLNVTLVMRDGEVGTPREVVGLLEKQKPTVYIGEYSLMVRRGFDKMARYYRRSYRRYGYRRRRW